MCGLPSTGDTGGFLSTAAHMYSECMLFLPKAIAVVPAASRPGPLGCRSRTTALDLATDCTHHPYTVRHSVLADLAWRSASSLAASADASAASLTCSLFRSSAVPARACSAACALWSASLCAEMVVQYTTCLSAGYVALGQLWVMATAFRCLPN